MRTFLFVMTALLSAEMMAAKQPLPSPDYRTARTTKWDFSDLTVRPSSADLNGKVMYQLFLRMFTPEGTLAAARAKLPFVRSLGTDIIYLTPFVQADGGTNRLYWSGRQKSSKLDNPFNPYRISNYFAVDPEYGTEQDVKDFVNEAHRLGMKVLFDVVYYHCGPNAVFLKDHPDWVLHLPDGRFDLGKWAFPRLDIDNPELREHLFANMKWQLTNFNCDGFRCDVGEMLPLGYRIEAARRNRAIKPDVIMMDEGHDPRDQQEAFDLDYCYRMQWAIRDMMRGRGSATNLYSAIVTQMRHYPKGYRWMRCFQNHDFANCDPQVQRAEKLYGLDMNDAMLATIFTLDGVPMIYNGQEIADAARHSIWSNRDHGRLGIDWSCASTPAGEHRLALVRAFMKLRHDNPDLTTAPTVFIPTDHPAEVYAFRRPLPSGVEFVTAVNISSQEVTVKLPSGLQSVWQSEGVRLEASGKARLPAKSWVVARHPCAKVARPRTAPAERVKLIAPVRVGELRLRPTFCSCGVCFGAAEPIGGLRLEYRTSGGAWKAVENFPYFTETRDYRGSILSLDENTAYDVRLTQGEKVIASGSTRTWSSQVKVAKTVLLDPKTMKLPFTISERGQPDGWIRYTAPKGAVIVNDTNKSALLISDAAYVLVEGLTIEGGTGRHVIEIDKSKSVRIANCDISGWGRPSKIRYDRLGRPCETEASRKGKVREVNFDGAIEIGRGCAETVVERCYIHDCRINANSWYYSHPAGGEAVVVHRPAHSTVIRWNDFIGSDLHRYNDAVESDGNFFEDGGFNRDADIYGNFMIFCADDCIELDGGQQNVRCFGNRFESALCGVSIQGCMASPTYVYDNTFFSMCDRFGDAGQTIKTGGGAHGEEATAYIWRNLLWGKGMGVIWMDLLRMHSRDNTFCGAQGIRHPECSPLSTSKGDRFNVDLAEEKLPNRAREIPVGFTLSRSRFSAVTLRQGVVSPASLQVVATSEVNHPVAFEIRKNRDFPWLKVSPEKGEIPAKGQLAFTISFDASLMTDRHDYRGAFLVRTPEGLSRGVSVYVETDFVPPFRAEKPGDVAVYAETDGCVLLKPGTKTAHDYTFTVPKDGRYYFLYHATVKGRPGTGKQMQAALDDESFKVSRAQLWSHPVWAPVAPGNTFGNMLRYWDFKAGEKHTLRIRPGKSEISFDGVVMTDNPGSFEPR